MIPLKLRTETGYNLFSFGFIVSIIAYVIMGLIALAAYSAVDIEDVQTGPMTANPFGWAPILWFVIGLTFANIVMFVSFILYVPGLWLINKGKWEFGPAHLENVRKGVIFVIIGPMLGIIGNFNTCLVGPFVGIVSAVMTSYGLMVLAMEPADRQGKALLKDATFIFIILSIIIALVNLWFFFSLFNPTGMLTINDLDFFLWGQIIPLMVNVFYILPLALYFIVYRGNVQRIRSGQVLPVLPPPPMMPGKGMPLPIPQAPLPIKEEEPK
jgi:hypothetical protein